jgi:tetratricopeptide (TPR) repeat protein
MKKQIPLGVEIHILSLINSSGPNDPKQLKEALKLLVTNKAQIQKDFYSTLAHSLAIKLHKNGLDKDSTLAATMAVEANEKNDGAANLLGVLYHEQNNEEKAISYYQKALKYNPNNPSALYNIGNSYLELNRNDDAIKFYERRLQQTPDHIDTLTNISIAQSRIGQYTEAKKNYNKIPPNSRDINWYINYSTCLAPAEALSLIDYALKNFTKPDDIKLGTLYYNKGVKLSHLGKLEEAAKVFSNAMSRLDKNSELYIKNLLNLAITNFNIGDYESAMQNAKIAKESDNNNNIASSLYDSLSNFLCKNLVSNSNKKLLDRNLSNKKKEFLTEGVNEKEQNINISQEYSLDRNLSSKKKEFLTEGVNEKEQNINISQEYSYKEIGTIQEEEKDDNDLQVFANEVLSIQNTLHNNPHSGFKELNNYYLAQKNSIKSNDKPLSNLIDKYVIHKISYFGSKYNICFHKDLSGLDKQTLSEITSASDHFAKAKKGATGIIYIKPNMYKIKFGKDLEVYNSKFSENGIIFDKLTNHNTLSKLYHNTDVTNVPELYISDNCITCDELKNLIGASEEYNSY